ncbi:uncharacterized protein LOC144291330 [Canis aureus]
MRASNRLLGKTDVLTGKQRTKQKILVILALHVMSGGFAVLSGRRENHNYFIFLEVSELCQGRCPIVDPRGVPHFPLLLPSSSALKKRTRVISQRSGIGEKGLLLLFVHPMS